MSRVAITGLGMTSCLGISLVENWNMICGKVSGLTNISSQHTAIGGKLSVNVFTDFGRMYLRHTNTLHSALSLSSAIEVLNNGHFFPENDDQRFRIGISESLSMSEIGSSSFLTSGAFTGANIATAIGIKGPITTTSGGLQAIFEAAQIIRSQEADVMLVIGSGQELTEDYLGKFAKMGLLSQEKNYSMFSGHGMVLGEGSGAVMLENLDHALKRNARIYCEIDNFAQAGPQKLYEMDTRLPLTGDVIIANSSGTEKSDLAEVKMLENQKKVVSIKGNIGWVPSAAGILDTIIGSLIIHQGVVPPNCTESSVKGINLVKNLTLEQVDKVAVTSFTFTGGAACLGISRFLNK
ncbi:hypothetical protein SteCoe_10356 [Stentor coeruleus]|uniref:beta-ketoacyl-[acyl-carrier-protein] synthase I n=1 Tax=Stentor coeruleus TaxID=5963 RepID=A0A1R2CG03_9CILI|nr:hypothetical protein SteCoe_10356 [Stentor coeruleus]